MTVRVTSSGLSLDDAIVPLISGAVHYWRLDRKVWGMALDLALEMGFSIVETYIPWSVHEISQGQFDFGTVDPRKDIDAFMHLCEDKGLHLIARPGPHINAELTYFGYPKRIIADAGIQARTSYGTPAILPVFPRMFPVPSYASNRLYGELETYFNALQPILRRHIHPKGCVIAIQSDNEMSHFFRVDPYDLDYCHDAIDLYRTFLRGKYRSIGRLNDAYRSGYRFFKEIDPPRRFDAATMEDLPRHLDWAEYKEEYLVRAHKRIVKIQKKLNIKGIPVMHNYPMEANRPPLNIPRTEAAIDIQGVDLYAGKTDYAFVKRSVLFTAGMSRLPSFPEFASGCYPCWKPIDLEDQRFTTLVTLMFGAKAINFYMLVERERWYGSPITRDGRIREDRFAFYRDLNRILDETGLLGLERECDVILLEGRDYTRLESLTSALSPISQMFLSMAGIPTGDLCLEDDFGFGGPPQIEHRRLFDASLAELSRRSIPFVLGDTEMTLPSLLRYRLAVVNSFAFMDGPAQERLADYVKQGGTLLMGPVVPALDASMRPCTVLKDLAVAGEPEGHGVGSPEVLRAGKGRIVLHRGEAGDFPGRTLAPVVEMLGIEPSFKTEAPVEWSLFRGEKTILFLVNPTEGAVETALSFDATVRLEDQWTGEEIGAAGLTVIPIGPFTVRMFEVAE